MISKIKKSGVIYGIKDDRIPELPADGSEKTYVLKSINGVVSWVEETEEPTIYNITASVTNGAYTGDETIEENGTAEVVVSADSDYELPDEINVTNATFSWDKQTGAILLSEATGDVVITVVCEEALPPSTYTITTTITDGTASGDTTIEPNIGTATIVITPDQGKVPPLSGSDITVVNAELGFEANSDNTVTITVSSPSDNVSITATCPTPNLTPFVPNDVASAVVLANASDILSILQDKYGSEIDPSLDVPVLSAATMGIPAIGIINVYAEENDGQKSYNIGVANVGGGYVKLWDSVSETFEQNPDLSAFGGALAWDASTGTLSLTNTTMTINSATHGLNGYLFGNATV